MQLLTYCMPFLNLRNMFTVQYFDCLYRNEMDRLTFKVHPPVHCTCFCIKKRIEFFVTFNICGPLDPFSTPANKKICGFYI